MRLSLRGRRTITAGMATAIAAVTVLTGACAPTPSSKVISGTIKGADGKIVDVLMGFAVQDSAGHMLNLGNPGTGYSVLQRLNHCVTSAGAATSQVCANSGQKTTYNWSLKVPGNAVKVFIEVYPKDATANSVITYPGYSGIWTGVTDTSTYATGYRPAIPLLTSRSNVAIVLPKVCTAGGSTGSLNGTIRGWPSGVKGNIHAFSLAPDQPTMGFATAYVNGDGSYNLAALASGQRYGLIVSGGSYSKNLVDYRRSTSSDTLIATPCQKKRFDF
jgi:hypothetical protein